MRTGSNDVSGIENITGNNMPRLMGTLAGRLLGEAGEIDVLSAAPPANLAILVISWRHSRPLRQRQCLVLPNHLSFVLCTSALESCFILLASYSMLENPWHNQLSPLSPYRSPCCGLFMPWPLGSWCSSSSQPCIPAALFRHIQDVFRSNATR